MNRAGATLYLWSLLLGISHQPCDMYIDETGDVISESVRAGADEISEVTDTPIVSVGVIEQYASMEGNASHE